MNHPPIALAKRHEQRVRAGHLWVFSNEIDRGQTPLDQFEPGSIATLTSASGKPLALVTVNPHSLICARILTRDTRRSIDQRFWTERLREALALRTAIGRDRYGRIAFGDSDRMPGVVLDRFGDTVCGQLTTAGAEAQRDFIEAAIRTVLEPSALIWRNDFAMRELEGLPRETVQAFGDTPQDLVVVESGVDFLIDAQSSQKTGWFYDQASNRDLCGPWMGHGRVLDLFCYRGGWGLRAAAAGADHAVCVDSSAPALADVQRSAQRNGLADRVEAVQGDVNAVLAELAENKERFDTVIVDPPAFAKRRKDIANAKRGYRKVNELALRVLAPGGLLISCSCSHHLREDALEELIGAAARHVDRDLRVLARLQQGPDHPVHPSIPETRYLKGLVARVTPPR